MPANYGSYSYRRRALVGPPRYQGSIPTRYVVTQTMPQWTPQLNRLFSIPSDESKIEFQWPRLAGIRTFDERWELKKRIRRVVGEGATAYVYNRGDRHWVMGDTSAIANDQQDYLHQISVRPSVGLFSLVSQISPNGGDNFEDLTILDPTDPNQWLLVIEVPRDDGLVVYRRLFRELDR